MENLFSFSPFQSFMFRSLCVNVYPWNKGFVFKVQKHWETNSCVQLAAAHAMLYFYIELATRSVGSWLNLQQTDTYLCSQTASTKTGFHSYLFSAAKRYVICHMMSQWASAQRGGSAFYDRKIITFFFFFFFYYNQAVIGLSTVPLIRALWSSFQIGNTSEISS